ncbi:hypothetical protein VIGAN_01199200 [Vigna angularis var. angularis]|uniref:Uncharacterized protein n=1 Tax=Vigna angularis var. angularis TaxID=157739 RepID=A0A0S3R197_PHAAN|nr:hypothetical protein VIGAN_01199200 [Vigna angularis var. angularis]
MHLSGVAVDEEEPAETVLAEVVRETDQGYGGESRLKRHDHHFKALNLIPIALHALTHGQRHKWRRHSNRRKHAPRNHQSQHRVLRNLPLRRVGLTIQSSNLYRGIYLLAEWDLPLGLQIFIEEFTSSPSGIYRSVFESSTLLRGLPLSRAGFTARSSNLYRGIYLFAEWVLPLGLQIFIEEFTSSPSGIYRSVFKSL